MTAHYAFAAHPDALADLSEIPDKIRDMALLELQHLVHGNERGAALQRELTGCHKVYVDPQTRWRMVIEYRDAPTSSTHHREMYLLSVGERHDHAAYRSAARRLEREHQRGDADPYAGRARAARARSTHAEVLRADPAGPAPQAPGPQPRLQRVR